MDSHLTGEDAVTKIRRRYTLTKERGQWSIEEHDKFLEGLKLYGRAWSRIREHVGTKTAVQIRSHAQKFFGKLQNDAPFRGISRVDSLDIDIPPPRRKRKLTTIPASSSSQPEIMDERRLDSAKEQVQDKSAGEEQAKNENENHDHKTPETSFIPPMAALRNSSSVKGFSPWKKPSSDSHHARSIHAPPTSSKWIARALLPKPASHAATGHTVTSWPAGSAVCNQRCYCCMLSNSCPGSGTIPALNIAPASARWPTHALVPLSVPGFGNTVATAREAGSFEKFRAKSSVIQNVNGAEYLNQSCGVKKNYDFQAKPEDHKHFPTILNQELPGYQVLFGRELHPKGFSPQQNLATRETVGNLKHIEGENNIHLTLNLESGCHPRDRSSEKRISPTSTENDGNGKIVIGIGQGKFNSDQTGFKPYKRCSNPSIENGRKGKLVLGIGQRKLNNHQTGFKPYKRCSITKD